MINYINIRNFAIIENTEIYFDDGLNIITGETGSGKSIIIEAISLALGARADSSYVRTGTEKATVQLSGTLDGDDVVIVREVGLNGKNLCKLNGNIVTLAELNETCVKLADIHGQYDNQHLLNNDHHIILLDNYQKEIISPIKEAYKLVYDKYVETNKNLIALKMSEKDNLKKADFLKYEANEIKNAKLIINEDIELEKKISLLQNSEKISNALEFVNYTILGDENANATLSNLRSCLSELESISKFDDELSDVTNSFADTYYKIEDLATTIRRIKERSIYSDEDLNIAIERNEQINALKRKYGKTIEDILEYETKISKELDDIENFEERINDLEILSEQLSKEICIKASMLSDVRNDIGEKLASALMTELRDLNFNESDLSVGIKKSSDYLPSGNDIVELLISTNKGEPLKPLSKVASGGEISRIMLAFKKVTCSFDQIPTMIFDEIDTGISGQTANIVARKLKEIATSHQIICITHLPQIASKGGSNYLIQKESDEHMTYTTVVKLSETEKIDEIARLLGGDVITDITRQNALELMGEQYK